jgi:hypothetical protein
MMSVCFPLLLIPAGDSSLLLELMGLDLAHQDAIGDHLFILRSLNLIQLQSNIMYSVILLD